MSGRRDTRYPHAFSKGRGPGFVSEGSWRQAKGRCTIQTAALGAPAPGGEAGAEQAGAGEEGGGGANPALKQRSGSAKKTPALEQRSGSAKKTPAPEQRGGNAGKPPPLYPLALDPRRWALLKVSPTVATLYKSHAGIAVVCADCLHGVGHRNPGLPDRFKRQWHLTLLELERRCRCEMCGSRNARAYPWWGEEGGELGLRGPPGEGR